MLSIPKAWTEILVPSVVINGIKYSLVEYNCFVSPTPLNSKQQSTPASPVFSANSVLTREIVEPVSHRVVTLAPFTVDIS